MYVSLPSFCSFVQESNACNHLFCNVIWSGPCNSSFCNSSLEQRIWERDECGWGVRPSSLCLSALLCLNVPPSVWLTARPGSCWQLRLGRVAASLSSSLVSLCIRSSIHPRSSFLFSLLPFLSLPISYFASSLFLPYPLSYPPPQPPPPPLLSSLPPVATPTIRSHLSVCTSAIRASWQPNASHVPKLHTHTQANTHT